MNSVQMLFATPPRESFEEQVYDHKHPCMDDFSVLRRFCLRYYVATIALDCSVCKLSGRFVRCRPPNFLGILSQAIEFILS